MQIGGSILSISLNGRQFSVPADADFSQKIGGFENEVMANGDSTSRLLMTRVPFKLSSVSVAIDDTIQDFEFLQSIADAKEFADLVVEFASGALWTGQGQIIGELTRATATATSEFEISGTGTLVQQ